MRKLNKKSPGLHRYAAKDRAGVETATPMAKRVPIGLLHQIEVNLAVELLAAVLLNEPFEQYYQQCFADRYDNAVMGRPFCLPREPAGLANQDLTPMSGKRRKFIGDREVTRVKRKGVLPDEVLLRLRGPDSKSRWELWKLDEYKKQRIDGDRTDAVGANQEQRADNNRRQDQNDQSASRDERPIGQHDETSETDTDVAN